MEVMTDDGLERLRRKLQGDGPDINQTIREHAERLQSVYDPREVWPEVEAITYEDSITRLRERIAELGGFSVLGDATRCVKQEQVKR